MKMQFPWIHMLPNLRSPAALLVISCMALSPLVAQTDEDALDDTDADLETVFELSPFTVDTDRQYGYRASSSVSGTRVATAVKDLPFSLRVVTDEFISDLKVSDIEDAVRFVPAIQDNRDNLGNFGKFNVRGIQQTYSLRNGFRRYGPNDTSAAAQVEVVKGPAGLLYGQVFPGGVVNVVTKKPLPFENYTVELRYSNYGSYRASTDLTGPISKRHNINYRLVSAYEDYVTFVDYNEREVIVFVPSLSYSPTKWLNFTLEYEHFERNEDAPHAGMIALNLDDLALAIANPDDPFGMKNDWTKFPEKFLQSSPRVTGIAPYLPRGFNTNGPGTFSDFTTKTWTLYTDLKATDWLTFRSALIYYDYLHSYYLNFANNTLRSGLDMNSRAQFAMGGNTVFQSQNDFSLTFSTGALDHRMLIGAEYYADRFEASGARETSSPNPSAYYIRFPNPWDVSRDWNVNFQGVVSGNIRYLNPIADFALSPRPEALPPISKGDDRETTGYAVYITDQIVMMNERLRLLGGMRYERFYTDNFITGAEGDEDDMTFQAGAMYQLTPWLSLFANYSESFYRNEFYNQFGPAGMAGKMAPPQQGEGIDIGFKLDDPKGRWSGTISYYDLSQKNILINTLDANNNSRHELAGARESTGFEFDFHFAPTPSWQILLNYAYISTKDVDTGTAFPNVPKHQGSVFTRYEFTEGPLAGFALGGGAVYMGDRPGGNDSNIISQNWDFVAESYIAVDAFVSRKFAWRTHDLTVQFNVSNLTDEEYIRGGQTLPSEPRRYTLSLTFDY